jgi:hypothetical protein
MFAHYVIDSITNGVHADTWTAPSFQTLFDRHIPGWREDNFSLRYALSMPQPEVWAAHMAVKRQMIQYVNRETNAGMDVDVLTLGLRIGNTQPLLLAPPLPPARRGGRPQRLVARRSAARHGLDRWRRRGYGSASGISRASERPGGKAGGGRLRR